MSGATKLSIFTDKTYNWKQRKEEASPTVVWIPYQLCPKCDGEGVVLTQPYPDALMTVQYSTTRVCPVCDGAKLISMKPLNLNTENV